MKIKYFSMYTYVIHNLLFTIAVNTRLELHKNEKLPKFVHLDYKYSEYQQTLI